MPQVSVIIPSYNHGRYIRESIQSVLNQTHQDFEIVITDDGSTDNSIEVIESFQDKRIKLYVFKENKGASQAANNCILHSTGDYIAMLSSDDTFLPGKIERQLEVLTRNRDLGVVFTLPKMVGENNQNLTATQRLAFKRVFKRKNRDRYSWLNYFFKYGNCLCHPSALIRRECFEAVGLYDKRYASLPDFDLWVRICFHYEIFIIHEELIRMRLLKNNLNASSFSSENASRCVWEYKYILEHYLNLNNEDYKKIFRHSIKTEEYDKTIIKYYIAKQAIKNARPSHKMFAMDQFYSLVNGINENEASSNEVNFISRDLVFLSGNTNIFFTESLPYSIKSLFKLFSKQLYVSFIKKYIYR